MIAIITDSTCDIPADLVEKYAIQIVPQYIIWGDEQFKDRVELSPQAFYQRFQTDPQGQLLPSLPKMISCLPSMQLLKTAQLKH